MSVISNLQGAGESGKSTIVKQMRILHDVHGFTEQWVCPPILSQLFSIQIIRSEEGKRSPIEQEIFSMDVLC